MTAGPNMLQRVVTGYSETMKTTELIEYIFLY